MKGVFFLGDKRLELREIPYPEPGPGEVVIQMKAAGICGSDLRRYRHPLELQPGYPDKLVIKGHEPCGVVNEVGPGVTNTKSGDRVIIQHFGGCGFCKYCRKGYPQYCVQGPWICGYNHHGADAEFMLVRENMCIPLSDNMSFEEGAACACGTGTAFAALKNAKVSGRDTIAIYGQGPVGLSATLLGSAINARVIAVDIVPDKLDLAEKLGASEIINANKMNPVKIIKDLTDGEGADIAMDCTGTRKGRTHAVDSVAIFGKVCFVGEGNDVIIDVSRQLIHKDITIYAGWIFHSTDLEELSNYIVERSIPLKKLITYRFGLDQAEDAFRAFDSGSEGKSVFVWD